MISSLNHLLLQGNLFVLTVVTVTGYFGLYSGFFRMNGMGVGDVNTVQAALVSM